MVCPWMRVQVSSLRQLFFSDGLCLAETSVMTCPCCKSTIDSWEADYQRAHERGSGATIVKGVSNFQLPISRSGSTQYGAMGQTEGWCCIFIVQALYTRQ
jgi:hypothetical protein